jgi:hypothetical protein
MDDSPSVASVTTSVPEHHTSMTTVLEHFDSHEMPSAPLMSCRLAISPAMQTVIVNRVSPIHPELASIIRND